MNDMWTLLRSDYSVTGEMGVRQILAAIKKWLWIIFRCYKDLRL